MDVNFENAVDNPKLYRKYQDEITSGIWPEFMLHDSVANRYWHYLYEKFPKFQILMRIDGEIAGTANTIPYYYKGQYEDLPEEGWDWVFKKGLDDNEKGIKPNMLNGLQIVIKKKFQGKGLSSLIVSEMRNAAANAGFDSLTVAVRPTKKSRYPVQSIDDYIKWKRDDGLPFDPWLRVHVRLGARIIKPCHQAMHIEGTVSEWENWTGMAYPVSGEFVVPGALTAVRIDTENDIGIYEEPNVWIVHRIRKD